MSKGVALQLLATIAIVVIKEGSSLPGVWINKAVEPFDTLKLVDLKWIPKGRNKLVFGVQSCADVTLTLYETSDQSNQYVLFYLGYYQNSYALIIPSSDCDSDGNCNIVNFSEGAYLDCSNFMFFWISWDLTGQVFLGVGYEFGVNTIIAIANGLTVEPYYADILFDDPSGGQMYVFLDDPPVFINPLPDGTTVLEIEETNTVYLALLTAEVSDPEADPAALYVLDDYSDVFTFSDTTLTNIAPLDYEKQCEYAVKLTLYDNDNAVFTMLTIKVQNVIDEPPNVDAMSVSLPEELPIGSYIDSGLTVSDSDEGDQLTYSLSGSHASYFEVTADGKFKVAARIDFDPPNSIKQLDQLTLTVTDLNSNSNYTTLTFAVTDVNDMKPTFSQAVYTAEVTEGSGTVALLQLTITDADSGVNADFDVTMDGDDPSDPAFTFDPSTLQLSVDASKLDYEGMAATDFTSTLTFVATDKATESEPRTGTAVAVIKVLPDNEFAPVWAATPADLTIDESSPPGTIIGTYEATDEDLSTHGDVIYQVVSLVTDQDVDAMGTFFLDSGTGQLKVASPVDADSQTGGAASYHMTIQAADCCSRNVQASFRINVVGENDNAPSFSEVSYKAELSEDAATDKVVLDLQATDADGDELTYSLLGNENEHFHYISPSLIVLGRLDYETKRCYSLTLRASDGKHETDVPIIINIINVIDEAPVLTVNTPVSLLEEQPVGTPLGGVYDVTDRDEDDSLTYSIEGTESFYFNIDPTTGVIYLAQRVDREAGLTSTIDVTLKVTDAGGNVASEALTFDITDINDNSPEFISDVIHMEVTENTEPDILLSTLEVTDADAGNNAKVVVSIVSGDDATPDEKFQLIGSELRTSGTFIDYETLSSANFLYTLTVQAVDQPTTEAAKTSVAVVVVTVVSENEHSPTWEIAPSDITVTESTDPGSQLGHYTAIDDDVGADGDVTYQLMSVTDDSGRDGSEKFHLDSGEGKLILASPLDYDKPTGGATYYDVMIQAIDGGATAKFVESSFRISVGDENDNAPKFDEGLYQAVITEHTDVHTKLLSVIANDADDDMLTYTLVGDGTEMFAYDDLNNIMTTSMLDYESKRCYTFLLRVTDGVHQTDVPVNVNVSNVVDETPIINANSPVSLNEEQPINTKLGGVYDVTDGDEGDTLTYTLEGTGSTYFSIDPSTGVISVAQRIDREDGLTSITDVTLKVTDSGGNVASEALTFDIVDINDNSPQFSSDVVYVNVSENTGYGQVIKQLTCVDNDEGENANIVYSIITGDDPAIKFKMDGSVLVTEDNPLDYESLVSSDFTYTLIVKAEDTPSDEAAKSNLAVVVVKVLPENEFTPEFTLPAETSMTVPETSKPPYLVTTFNAVDEDAGADGDVSYEILSAMDSAGNSALDKFLINDVSGELRLNGFLDADTSTGGTDTYSIVVKAIDGGTTPKSSNRNFVITVVNENDNAPVFLNFPTSIEVAENTDVGHPLVTLTTEDIDGDDVVASIEDGDRSFFIISGNNVILEQTLDYETSQCHTIVVGISDGTHKINRTLVIKVTDEIDETPSIVTLTPVSVTEELPVDTVVGGLFLLTDLDRDDSHTFTLSGSDSNFFNIDADSGQVSIAERMDLESMSGRNVLDQLTLTVTDSAGLQASADLTVDVVDINDATPVFAESVYKVNVSEGSSNELLLDLVASDADSGRNGEITMQITAGDDPASNRFELKGTQLSSLGNLDYESLADTQHMFLLTVEATDSPENESPKTGVTMVAVTVLPENEFTPEFTLPAETSMTVPETSKPPYLVTTFNAVDEDAGADGDVSYEILSATDSTGKSALDKFLINAVSGELRLNDFLDADTSTGGTDIYNIVVKAIDGGTTPKSSNRDFVITVVNENDNAPVFLNFPASIDVLENTDVGHPLVTLITEDNDGDDVVTSIEDGDKNFFIINGNNVILEQTLDYETSQCHTIVVGISDGTHKINRILVIKVTDEIDETPSIATLTPVSVTEELPVDTVVGGLFLLTDLDRDDSHTFTLSGGDSHFFNIDADSGQVSIAERMDLESMSGRNVLDQLTLTVTDSAGLQASADLTVDVVDINDATPVFAESVYKVNVSEGSPNEVLLDLVASDADSGRNGEITMQITAGDDPVSNRFELSGTQLSSLGNLDYESLADTQHMFLLTVEATDSPEKESPKTGVTMVSVTVLPENEFAPEFTLPAETSMTVPETSKPPYLVTTFNAVDEDAGADGDVSYEILSATDSTGKSALDKFLINAVSGELRLNDFLDADTSTGGTDTFSIVVKATDGGTTPKSSNRDFVITVVNENDNAPVLLNFPTSIDVFENTDVGHPLVTLTTEDNDRDDVVASIEDGDKNFFIINGNNVILEQTLDYETSQCHTIVVGISDGTHKINRTLVIKVTDEIDETPSIVTLTPVSVTEELPVDTVVGGLFLLTDLDRDDSHTFTLSGGDSHFFNIDADSGQVSIAERMDLESMSGRNVLDQLTLTVTDSAGLQASADLTVDVVDINDATPVFAKSVYKVNVSEGSSNEVLLDLVASDADSGRNGEITMQITAGDDPVSNRFELSGTQLSSLGNLDYESLADTQHMFLLTVEATDSPEKESPKTGVTMVSVTVLPENEFAPEFTLPAETSMTVTETSKPPYLVTTFNAVDEDAGADGDVSYEILSATDSTGKSALDKFLINAVSGELRLNDFLDADTSTGGTDTFSIVVKATDGGTTPKSSNRDFVITVVNENDNAPVFLNFPTSIEVAENTDVGHVLVTLTTEDIDGDDVVASIEDGDKTFFFISGNNVILEQKITDGTYHTNRTLVLKVIDVIDETPSIETLTPVNVTEELPVGTTVGGLFLHTDLDRGDSHTFTLTGGDSHFFNIDAGSGQVSVAERMDLESMSGRNVLDQLTLTVTDTAGLQATVDLSVEVVDINDATPVFAESVYKVNVSEGSSNEVLLDLVASDADSGRNGEITMQITAGDDPVSNRFELSGTQLSSLGNLDYESLADTQHMFLLTVEATDLPEKESPKTGVTMVSVTVLPVNEFAPDWATSMSLTGSALPDLTMLENVTVGSELLTLQATDSDQGVDGDVTYIITSAITNTGEQADGLFALNSVSGTLRTAGNLDRDITTGEMYYDLTITARDGGDPYKETSATLRVILDNVNDNAPEFTLTDYQIDVEETTVVDTAIYTFDATDVDGDVVVYSIKEGDTDVFSVQGTSLVTLTKLDYETVSWYPLLVESSDGLYTRTVLLLVKVIDEIDEEPVITVSNPVTLLEELPIDTDVSWTFDVTDNDIMDDLRYSLNGPDSSSFNVNPDTGVMTVAKRLDREVKARMELTLRVEDSSGLFSEADISITLSDINDFAPTFDANTHVIYTPEGGQGDVDLVTLVVTDRDEGDNADFDVTITSGNDGGEFRLDGLVLKGDSSMIDYESAVESNYTYILSIQAVDKPLDTSSLTGSTVVIVHVQALNEYEPVFEAPVLETDGRFPEIAVDEDVGAGHVVITFDATDQDAGIDGDVTYDIVSVQDEKGVDRSDLFTLDNKEGILRTSGQLDFDQSTGGFEYVTLVIRATDGGAVMKSTEGIQRIVLSGVNDKAPYFKGAPSEVNVDENMDVDAVILDLDVQDPDGDDVTLTLSGSAAFQTAFGNSVILIQQLDFESRQCHTLTVSASDGTHETSILITVNVLNVVDEAPEVTLLPPLTLTEEQPLEMGIGWFFSVSDPDIDDTVTYTLSGTGAQYFNLESSGELTIAKRIDRDRPDDVTFIDDLLLTVTDSAGLQTSVSWNLTVVDINDNAPVCDVTDQANITENSAEDVVISDIACTDLDSGEYGVVGFNLEAGVSQFKLSGTQLITSGDPVDYETTSDVYNVKIVAVDNPAGELRLTSTSVVTIKVLPVNEYTPVFISPEIHGGGNFVEVSVAEDADIGAVIDTFMATDGDLGSDGHVTYGIQSVISDSGAQHDGLFTIDGSSGELRVSGQLDADAVTGGVDYYIINITATDEGSTPRSTHSALRVNVEGTNDNTPVWNITVLEADVFENVSVGQDVVSLMVDDVDRDDVTFSTTHTKFKVDGSMLKVDQQLDFEFEQFHTIVVSATDGTYTVDQTLVVQVLDSNDETPVVTVTKMIYIPEEIPLETDVARGYIVSDADEDDTLTYSLQGEDSDLLVVDSTTGQLTLGQNLDFETLTSATLDVKLHVTDEVGHSVTEALEFVVTDINDNTPTFSSAIYRVEVTEQTAGETELLTLSATDADDGDNGKFSFNISDGNSHNFFRLDENVLYVQSKDVDYEEAEGIDFTYSVTVTAVDHATDARTGAAVVVVEIIPVNEHDPVLKDVTDGKFPETSLPEDTAPGSEVLTVHATDADLGEDGEVTYAITSVLSDSADAPGKFTIDCDTGVLTTASELDFDATTGGSSYYDITVTASDKGTTPRTSSAVLRVSLTDSNDIAPVFTDVSYTANVGCNDGLGSEVLTLTADDEDGPSVEYFIDDNPYLKVDSASGAVTLEAFPTGGAVADLAQSVVVTASDGFLEDKCHLLVLFENCDNTTSVSTTTSATTTTTASCPSVTCNCSGNATVTDPTTTTATTTTTTAVPCVCSNASTSAATTSATTTISVPTTACPSVTCNCSYNATTTDPTTTTTTTTAAPCVCNNASTSAVSSTTTTPVTCPSDVTAAPCVCSNATVAAGVDRDTGDSAEVWAMRATVIVMSMMLMGGIAMYLKNALTKVPQSLPVNKVQPRKNNIERGIGRDDCDLRIEDFGKG